MLFLNGNDVHHALPMTDAIEVMREAFMTLSSGDATVPLRAYLDMPQHAGGALTMPVYIPALHRLSVKIVTIHKENPKRGLPMIHAVINLFDADTGELLAIMDGESITAIRTGAASGLATELLANEDATTMVLFGAGVQGKFQVDAVMAVRDIQHVFIFDTDVSRIETMVDKIKDQYQIAAQAGTRECLNQADIICTATSSLDPVFDDKDIKPGVHINGIGSYRPDMQEINAETIKRAHLFVDSVDACLAEAGDIVIPLNEGLIDTDHIQAEIGDVANKQHPGRQSSKNITVFKSVGNAVQDLTAASRIYDKAVELGLGQQIPL